jgi:alpha-glucosidase
MNFPFVSVNGFTPNTSGWITPGNINQVTPDGSGLTSTFTFGQRSLVLSLLGPRAFRLRFNPAVNASYASEHSVAVVNRDLGLAGLKVNKSGSQQNQLVLDTGTIRIQIALQPFSLSVFRSATNQLIHRDAPGSGVLYIPNQEVIAVMKSAAPGACYVGCGEKAGSQLLKNNFTFTYFNFDNFSYGGPSEGDPGPLNPTEPLYCSIPFLIENNAFPSGDFVGSAYAYGIFLDNTAQTFVNVTANDYSDMTGKYYLGSLYNELDYYFLAGDNVAEVLSQYTALTGRSSMPPRYVFGLHQGAYGYYDQYKLNAAAAAYRNAQIPCDGLHIDVDFQDNYRTFTHSEIKFPNVAQIFASLHQMGFKLSTNITPLITNNELGETGQKTDYTQRDNLVKGNGLLLNSRADSPADSDPYDAGVNYGSNRGSNPYASAYPPLMINNQGTMPLTSPGNYPDFGRDQVRTLWGAQYQHLINEVGLDMIWQDMTCPAIDPNLPPDIEQNKTFAQDLLMARESTDQHGNLTVNMLPNAKLHNSYVLNLLSATWNGITQLRPGTRNFIIARGGYAGMQRFAGLWTGDSASTWDFLRINIPEVLNLGLSGVPISGCDIGGFAKIAVDGLDTAFPDSTIVGIPFHNASVSGGITNYELLTRWMQIGSFLPWYRNHYDGYNKQFQEPYAYAEPVPTNCRRYVELRYRMMQVYYDAMYEWTQTGMPIARALFLNDPQDGQVYNHLNDQFFVGSDFLVAPIVDPHATTNPPTPPIRAVYLPAGSDWYAFMDNSQPLGSVVTGGTLIFNYFADLDRVPIYVRAGAILPFCELEQWVGQLPANPLTLNCYPGPDRWTEPQAYQLYQDDGITTQASAGKFLLSRVYQRTLQQNNAVTREVRVQRVQDNFQPASPFFFIAILGSVTKPISVSRDSNALTDTGDPATFSSSPVDAWYWNSSIQIAFAKIFDTVADTTVTFNF